MSDPEQEPGPAGERGWSLSAAAAGDGVRLELGLPDLDGKPVTAILSLSRAEARAFARTLLAASGDAAERSFPQTAKR
ncbi:hypothetical protein FV232_07105 [Methylobacterium sp. WL30]|jgi:hypothetical protein|uniref:hypothetical protein n=1 Tax=unclassified Methylobacterium TaxID=2615210 RepID=UPI0011C986A0|nr:MULTISPECIES: hypothetical protein [unclassified Methylobacterium]TXN40969.1 hypothetical protein FV225_04200 [Methylobacterium sp. WL93]TXN51006.1 hypothetical protein FV227_09305 [Methylobacterium sp. WL119]TXN68997.1 hypothetical protein FV232_07105 [Methylobacterium sp. WL30]